MTEDEKPSYAAMSAGDMLAAVGDDAHKWADAFCEMHGGDHGLMVAWFANAIEHSSDVRHWRRVKEPEALAVYIERLGRDRFMFTSELDLTPDGRDLISEGVEAESRPQ